MTTLRTLARETYRSTGELSRILLKHKGRAQAWRVGRFYSTVRLDSGRVHRKMFVTGPGQSEDAKLEPLVSLAEALARAKREPFASSWGGVWRQYGVFPGKVGEIPRMLMESEFVHARKPYPWIEQRTTGALEGAWQEWDISSAYAWASSLGLPDLRTVRRTDKASIADDAIYLVDGPLANARGLADWWTLPTWARIDEHREAAPGYVDYRRKRSSLAWVPGEFMNRFGLEPRKVRVALAWTHTVEFLPIFDRIREELPDWWKNVLRAHWGDWGASAPVVRETWENGRCIRESAMPTGLRSPLWSWIVQGRVTGAVVPAGEHAARIFIDSAVTPAEYSPGNEGTDLGQWKRKAFYPDGVLLRGLPWRPTGPSAILAGKVPLRCRMCSKKHMVDPRKVTGLYRCFRCRTGHQEEE